MKFNFFAIGDILDNIHELRQLDVCGIVHTSTQYDLIEVNFDHGKGKVKGRLSFQLIDRDADMITVYLWGDMSRMFISEGDLLILNGARVSHFNGKSLNCGQEHCKVLVNPPLDSIQDDIERFVDIKRAKGYLLRQAQVNL